MFIIDELDIHTPTRLRLPAALERLEEIQAERRERRASGTTVLHLHWLQGDIHSWKVSVSGKQPGAIRKAAASDLPAAIGDLVQGCMVIYHGFTHGRGDGHVALTIVMVDGEAGEIWTDFEEHVTKNGPRVRVGA